MYEHILLTCRFYKHKSLHIFLTIYEHKISKSTPKGPSAMPCLKLKRCCAYLHILYAQVK